MAAHAGFDHLAEVGEHLGIEMVGLGPVAESTGEVAGLAGIDHDGWKTRPEQGREGQPLVVAGRFEDDAVGSSGPDPGHECVGSFGDVGEAFGHVGRTDMDIKVGLADIDADRKAIHEVAPGNPYKGPRRPRAFLFRLMNPGCAPVTMRTKESPNPARTRLSHGLLRSKRVTVSYREDRVFHNPGFGVVAFTGVICCTG